MVSPIKGTGLWLEVKTAYQNGEGTLHELAERFNLGKKAVEARCFREGWKREMQEVCMMIKEKVAEQSASEATKWVKQTIERSFRYRSDIDATRSQSGSDASGNALLEPADIRTLAQAESVIDSMARRSLGLAERVDITTNGESLGDSFISAISKLRSDPSTPVLSSEDVTRVIDAPQID